MAKTETLVDDFASSIDAKWGGVGTGVSWVSGHAELSVDTTLRSLYAATTYDLTGSYVYARVTFPAAGNGTKQNSFEVSDSQTDGTNRARFFRVNASDLQLVLITGGSAVGSPTTITYSATDHAFLRFREAAGTLYWDTAPDNGSGYPGTWTQRHSQAIPTWGTNLTAIYPRFRAFRTGTEDPSVVAVDDVNVAAPAGSSFIPQIIII